MSNPGEVDATPITDRRQLAEYLAAGCKPPDEWRIGTEHERFGFDRRTFMPPPYEPNGIRAILEGLQRFGWTPILDQGRLIGLKGTEAQKQAAVSLEPGGQLELSGGLMETLHDTKDELARFFEQIRTVAEPMGLGFVPLGFHPTARREDMPWMPKSRYAIMRRYMPKKGRLGLDMMLRTCTVQANLDFESEADMVRKMRVSAALQPLATALFANSPFLEGRPSGFLSTRAHVWTDTDPDRTGIPAVIFESGFGFERYVDWVLDVPMYFIQREGRFIDLAGCSFRAFMAGKLPERPGEIATMGDFADHLTTVFPDVRLKRFIEMRGADAGTPAMMLAQSALWVGLLYDQAALAAAYALVSRYPWQDFAALRALVPRRGLATRWQKGTLRDLARDVVQIAADGLAARKRLNEAGQDERIYLTPLQAIAEGGPTQAEFWLDRYFHVWGGAIHRIFPESERFNDTFSR
ncbi:MAG: glutamate--cysteine ligase [Acetobacteraceae bacterium]|nr:glutamate--cysteine ligase [Acetobacteraceae bacterium]